jgi:hypothetical protein
VVNLIITNLIGGLGNQLFQYAVGRRLAYIHNEPLKLDITAFRNYTLRSYHLNPLNIIEQIATDEEISHYRNHHYIREEYFQFNSGILNLGPHTYLEGYWQSEHYFKDIEPIIRQEFMVKHAPEGENARLYNMILSCEAVAIHVRRGDYVSNLVTNEHHGLCPLDYYYQAVSIIANQIHNPHFFIFSDDWSWAQQNIHLNYPMTFVTHNANWPNEDLRLISHCKHHIIANSSFSWWGAWLGSYPHKIVIAPRKWFNCQERNTQDLIPDSWQVL